MFNVFRGIVIYVTETVIISCVAWIIKETYKDIKKEKLKKLEGKN